jgi:prophage regulatory protein
LRLADVCRLLGLSRSTVYQRIARACFPAPVRVSERAVRWSEEDVEDWLRALSRGTAKRR